MRLQRDAKPCQLPEGVSVPDIVKLNTLLVRLRAQRIEASNEVRPDPDSLYAYANNPANTVVPVDPHKMFVIGFQEDRTVNTTSSLCAGPRPTFFLLHREQ